MKPFKPRSIDQQRANYIKACRQRMSREIEQLKSIYFEDHERYAKLFRMRAEVQTKIDAVQDKVADDADKEFGGWDSWRHNGKLLMIVVKRMEDAVVGHRQQIAALTGKMERCMAKYRADIEAIANKYNTLIKTA